MFAARAERQTAVSPAQAEVAARWAGLDRRQVVDLALPGLLIGLMGGVIGGGLTAIGGQPLDTAVVSALALGLPLAAGGTLYEMLLAKGRAPLGPLAPAALVWMVCFPVARVIHAAVTDLYAGSRVEVPYGWTAFIVYQVLVAVAFAIGFWWLHENFAARWWFHIRDRNPVAHHFVTVQLQYAVAAQAEKEQRRAKRRARASGGQAAEPAASERVRPRDQRRASRRTDG